MLRGRDASVGGNGRRRRSISRSRGGYDDRSRKRRRSRSRSTSKWGADRRRGRSKSRSGCRGDGDQHLQRTTEINLHLYGSGQHEQGDRDDQKLTGLGLCRPEDNQEDYQDDPEQDIEKQLENIRQRRQEILDKYKRKGQSEAVERAQLRASDSVGDTELSVGESFATIGGHNLLQKRFHGRPSSIKTAKDEKDLIFGGLPAGGQHLVRRNDLALVETSGLSDNWDDAEGYYCHRIGEVVDSRFKVAALHGRGVFSSVVRAKALNPFMEDSVEVAIKIIRNNAVMLKSGKQELSILKRLDGADPNNKRHCVRFLTSLVYRNHLCLVFESMHMSLREALKKSGWKTGFSLGVVRVYAKQLFLALKHLRDYGVLHCDIKPDNILVNEAKDVLKLCDFGSAMLTGENETTPYLVSRFYRAPEIILGLRYDHPLDMWSVGCCLYELFTGKVLFPGATNNDMLRLHMELKGPFPKKMLKKADFAHEHFDGDYHFCAVRKDPVTNTCIKRVLVDVKPKGIDSFVRGQGTSGENAKMLKNLKDLLDKIFILDPGKRLTVSQAFNHPFITGM